jgi:hypothetical protein
MAGAGALVTCQDQRRPAGSDHLCLHRHQPLSGTCRRQRLQIAPPAAVTNQDNGGESLNDNQRKQLLDLAEKLADADLSPEERMELVERMRQVLNHNGLPERENTPEQENGRRPRAPP